MTRLVVAVVMAVALTGCATEKDRRRHDVNHYIASVNEARQDSLPSWDEVRTAYEAIGPGRFNDSQLRTLATASATIRRLRNRVAAMKPPDDARPLRARLLHLFDLQASLASEVNGFATYVTAVTPVENQVSSDTTHLRHALQQAHQSGPEQKALTLYARQLDALRGRLRRLHPPKALVPWHAGQVERVTSLRDGARAAVRGLAAKDRALVQQGVGALTEAAAAAPVTYANRAAIVAYNARVRKIGAAAAAVAREQDRLGRTLT